ncbi:hypothetical protein [Streptomyces fulvorobeus]|uniref:Uncharacterized protein n=1 Tax=Streptomyces fulvorobeus TaxID=284028 RepID=A0A7J0C856_9ACTN|nr:hypothetical protein [Streptomyces fulvorobeus]NYE41732.1 hypothetical protein [Streptomyces fulvorobeus]GFM98103.1 hypothetical protein Sfulv_29140 [Streptomyces fulvorobeus]
MATHAAMPSRGPQGSGARGTARHHSPLAWALPLALGVIFGLYAAFIERDGGPATGGQVVLGLVSGAALAALCFVLGRCRHALPRELRAAAFGALTACAIGFLVSLTNSGVVRSAVMGVSVGAGVFCVAFYVYYTRED